jgi:hypothetical protein
MKLDPFAVLRIRLTGTPTGTKVGDTPALLN